MNYFKNYLIAFLLLMGCNFVVYGANDGFHWDNQRVQKGQIQDIDRYINPDEQQSMIKMLANNKIVSQNANVLENEVSLWVLDANPQHRPRQPLKHVLYVKKDNKVVAACLKGDKTSSDSLSSCVTDIIKWYGDIPIHICGSWGKKGDKMPFVSLWYCSIDCVDGGHLYFCSPAARVGFAHNTKVFFHGKDGVLDLYEYAKDVTTNAEKISLDIAGNDSRIHCKNERAYIDMYHNSDRYDFRDIGTVHFANHLGEVSVSHNAFTPQMTGNMGPFRMDDRSRAWIHHARSRDQFEINNHGIAVVIDSKLGEIKAQCGGYVILVNSTCTSKYQDAASEICSICRPASDKKKTYAAHVIKEVENAIVKQYSKAEELNHESSEAILREKLGEAWRNRIENIIINEKGTSALGKRTYSQRFQYEDEESESEKPGSDNSRSGSSHPDASESESEDERGKTKPVYGGKLGRPSTYIN